MLVKDLDFQTLSPASYCSLFPILGWAILDDTLFYYIYNSVMKLSIGFLIFCEAWQLVSQFTGLDDMIDNLNVTLMHFIALYRYKNMVKML